MKVIFKILIISFFLLIFQFALVAQPPPPPSGAGASGNSNVPGGNAPIGSGLLILTLLGAAYGGIKVYQINIAKINE